MAMRAGRTRVLVVCAVNGHGGPIKSMATVLKHVEGVEATLVTQISPTAEGRSAVELEADELIDIPRPRGAFRMVWCQLVLLRRAWALRKRIDVIHANGLTEVVVALPLALVARLPVVVWIHNYERPVAFRVAEPLLGVLGRRWRWLAVSQVAAEQAPGMPSTIIENPVDDDVVSSTHVESSELRVVYLAGTDRPNKGFDLLPQIISGSTCPQVRWRIHTSPPYSSGDQRCQLAWQELLDMDGRVEIRGRESDVATIFDETDLVLSPSRQESFNRVIAEGLANRHPFVASDIAAHRALADRTGAGCLFDLNDPASAGALIDRVATDASFRAKLRSNATEAAQLFDPGMIASSIKTEWDCARRPTP